MKLKYKILNGLSFPEGEFSFECLTKVDLKFSKEILIVNDLNPEFSLYLGKTTAIITKNGSPLSHLALVAHEYKTPVIICYDIDIKEATKYKKVLIKRDYIELK